MSPVGPARHLVRCSVMSGVEVKADSKSIASFGRCLWLITQGVEAVGLASTTVRLPKEISADPVVSLNHAYTKLSEVFEPWRISHTGNIYTRVLYRERNDVRYPLDLLRNSALDKQELEIARGLWEAFIAKMTITNDF